MRDYLSIFQRVFLALGIMAFSTAIRAQKIEFNGDGTLKSTPSSISRNDTHMSLNAPLAKFLTPDQKKKIKQTLLTKINNAIRNFQDTSMGTPAVAGLLFPDDIPEIGRELVRLRDYLKDERIVPVPDPSFRFMPSPYELETSILGVTPVFMNETKKDANKQVLTDDLFFMSPFTHWFVESYNQLYLADNANMFDMGLAYENGWRELENLYIQWEDSVSSLNSHRDHLICDPAYMAAISRWTNSLRAKIGDNDVVRQFSHVRFYSHWFWFTEGIFLPNPLYFTTPDRQYPENEPYRMRDAGFPKRLAKGFVPLEQLQQGNIWLNHVVLPYPEKHPDLNLLHYDAANHYATNKSLLPKTEVEGEPYKICVDNIAGNSNTGITLTSSAIPDQSSFQAALNGLTDNLTTALGSLTGIGTSLGSSGLAPILKPFSPLPGNSNISLQKQNTIAVRQKNRLQEIIELPKPFPGTTESIKFMGFVNGMYVNLNTEQNDVRFKKDLLNSLACSCGAYNPANINAFVRSDICYSIAFTPNADLDTSVANLIRRFERFVVLQQNKEIDDQISKIRRQQRMLAALLRIGSRDLPPTHLEIAKTASPILRTEVKDLPLEGSSKISYVLQEKTLNTGAKDSTITETVAHTFKVGQRHWFGISAGISYTLSDYSRKKITTNGTQLSVADDNDRTRAIAAIHFYPFSGFNQDNSILGISSNRELNRISILLGLGIPDPLSNYYIGPSYDIVPGFKIMGGWHFIKYTRYSISNNQILDQVQAYRSAGGFLAIGIDAAAFVKLIGLIK